IGKSQDDATAVLKQQGLDVKVANVDNDAAAGQVVDQDPKPEAKAHKGDTVTISVSTGPPQVALPDVVGKNIDDANNDLEQLGLTVVQRAQNSDRPQGEVLAQDPQPGTQVAKNSTVTLTVSSGTGQVTVPNVVDEDAGLRHRSSRTRHQHQSAGRGQGKQGLDGHDDRVQRGGADNDRAVDEHDESGHGFDRARRQRSDAE